MSWTDERVLQLKQLWGEGKTAAEIAKMLGGITRNAVIGKAHRLKLSGRVSPVQATSSRVEAALGKPSNDQRAPKITIRERVVSAPIQPSIREENIPIKGIQLTELRESTCRWPIGDPKQEGFKFCGCNAHPGMTYCDNHTRLAFQVSTRGKLKVDELAKIDTNVVRKTAG
ncbi:MAG: gcrA cell cycle regulator family protein [Micavibrio aeruginosavorus]|uniref:GcrA cell cycle regulator family protein n=1 Tax=Micavibrio aeruginosavorus TaxID=349221 RepID=A0A2W5HDH6_9BACT|nr:MAG: gcrA cell cycle regulator family protein [Micavibrio aeruginosavorus]